MRFSVGVLFLTMVSVSSAATKSAVGSIQHLEFNGYYAGMSKAAAKKLGYSGCRYGRGLGETSDSIYCAIPSPSAKLGTLAASRAELEFPITSREWVAQIHLNLRVSETQARASLVAVYGEPSGHEDDPTYDVWARGAETLKLAWLYGAGGKQRAYVTFDYSAAVGKSRARALMNNAKKSKDLSNF